MKKAVAERPPDINPDSEDSPSATHIVRMGTFKNCRCAPERYTATMVDEVRQIIIDADLTVIDHTPTPLGDGVTAIFVLSESAIVFHTWPEKKSVQINIDVCTFRRPYEVLVEIISLLLRRLQVFYEAESFVPARYDPKTGCLLADV